MGQFDDYTADPTPLPQAVPLALVDSESFRSIRLADLVAVPKAEISEPEPDAGAAVAADDGADSAASADDAVAATVTATEPSPEEHATEEHATEEHATEGNPVGALDSAAPTRSPHRRTLTVTDLFPPPNALVKGVIVGLLVVVPLTALAVALIGLFGIGDPDASYYQAVSFTTVFAGLPALVTWGGVARAAARAFSSPASGSLAAAVRVATKSGAVTGVGLVLLTVVPMGEVPVGIGHWLGILIAGATCGALAGAVLGLWVSYGPRDDNGRTTP